MRRSRGKRFPAPIRLANGSGCPSWMHPQVLRRSSGSSRIYGIQSWARQRSRNSSSTTPTRECAGTTLTIRTSTDPMSVAPSLRTVLSAIDRTQPLFDVKPLDVALADSIAPRRLTLLLLATFALSALLLVIVGIYGVVAYAVAQRTQEIGVRIALGATRRQVVAMVVRQGMAITLGGIALGLAAAMASTQVMTALLYEVTPTDLATFARGRRDCWRHCLRCVLRAGSQGIPHRSTRRTSVRVSGAPRSCDAGADSSDWRSGSRRGKTPPPRLTSRCGVGWGMSGAGKASVRQRSRVTAGNETAPPPVGTAAGAFSAFAVTALIVAPIRRVRSGERRCAPRAPSNAALQARRSLPAEARAKRPRRERRRSLPRRSLRSKRRREQALDVLRLKP